MGNHGYKYVLMKLLGLRQIFGNPTTYNKKTTAKVLKNPSGAVISRCTHVLGNTGSMSWLQALCCEFPRIFYSEEPPLTRVLTFGSP